MMNAMLKLAWKNVFRHRLRNVILAGILTLTSGLMIYSSAFHRGVQNSMEHLLVSTLTGHLQIRPPDYPLNCLAIPEINRTSFIGHYAQLIPFIQRLAPYIQAFTPRITFGAAIYREDLMVPIKISGIDPLTEGTVNEAYHLMQGQPLSAGDDRGILLSCELAEQLQVQIGENLDLLTGNVYGDIAARTFQIRGILDKSGLDVFIGGYAFIPISAAQTLLDVEGATGTLALKLYDPAQIEYVRTKLQHEFDNRQIPVVVNAWQDIRGIFDSMNHTIQFFGRLGNITLFLVIIIGIINSVLMSVFDRTREIGVLMAMGTTRRQIYALLLLEMILLATMAILSGILLSSAMILRLAKSGLTGVNETVATLWGGGRLFPQLVFSDVVIIYATLFCVVMVATLYPAAVAAAKNPTDALRHL
jgi:ABC-type lipoprotein release transport system permease subunit